MMVHKIYLVILLFSISLRADCQVLNEAFTFSGGLNISLNFKANAPFYKAFPGIKAFLGIQYYNELKLSRDAQGLLNMGTSIAIYNKSLGNSLQLGFQDNQLDWTSNINMGVGWGENDYYKLMQSINNTPFYNLRHNKENAVMLGVNFIMNNYTRHQTVGSLTGTWGRTSMTYYNDGGPFFSWFGLGDSFDRFWTGGLMIYYHDCERTVESDKTPFNRVEFSFDQFTGYKKGLYELQGILGIDLQDYDIYNESLIKNDYKLIMDSLKNITKLVYSLDVTNRIGHNFNASQYRLIYRFDRHLGAGIGMIGSLRDHKRDRYYALQDMLHIWRKHPIHPNRNPNKFQLLFEYNQTFLQN